MIGWPPWKKKTEDPVSELDSQIAILRKELERLGYLESDDWNGGWELISRHLELWKLSILRGIEIKPVAERDPSFDLGKIAAISEFMEMPRTMLEKNRAAMKTKADILDVELNARNERVDLGYEP